MRLKVLKVVICLLGLISSSVYALTVEKLASGLGIPWGLTFIDDNTLLVGEKSGSASLLNLSTKQLLPVSGLPKVDDVGQGGLLDLSILPSELNDSNKVIIYFTYSKSTINGTSTTLAKAELKGLALINKQDLLVTQSYSTTSRHFGSRIAFDQSGHVFFSVGDRGNRSNGQNLKTHSGSILRLNLDGSVPSNNPFVGNKNALDEIWSYGHRNPQGLTFDSSQQLWSIEHGPRGGDEINLIKKGANYGWPIISYGKEYWGPVSVGEGTHKEGMEQPVKYYVPSIAPSSLISYSGKIFKQWKNALLAGALKLKHINVISLNDDMQVEKEERVLQSLKQRVRAIIEAKDGVIYFSTDSGYIYRLVP